MPLRVDEQFHRHRVIADRDGLAVRSAAGFDNGYSKADLSPVWRMLTRDEFAHSLDCVVKLVSLVSYEVVADA
ncbi:MAG: hypothetical protein HZB26_14540 [Candidatus Hydrogenedentes bacterium]|nr:hypothetical protein [Candidatus Hydrogenedentota bacterium]